MMTSVVSFNKPDQWRLKDSVQSILAEKYNDAVKETFHWYKDIEY